MQRSTNRSVIHFFPYHRQPPTAAAVTEHGPSDRLVLRVPAEQVYASTKLDPLPVRSYFNKAAE